MNSPAESQLEAACPYCRATILVPADPDAKEVRCKKCAEKVPIILLNLRASSARQIVSETDTAQQAPAPAKPPAPPPPTDVRVICKLCGTIVYVPLADVGKEVQCPDCETLNVIPPPPKAQKKAEVRLDDADSFSLTEGIDQPDAQSAAMQQKWYMATCPICFSQLRLTVDQAGRQIDCPDCLSKFTAGQPPEEKKQAPRVVLDDTYELTLSEPVDRPPVDVEDLIGSKQVPQGSELKAAAAKGDLDSRDKLSSLYGLVKGEKKKGEKGPPEPEMPLPDIRGAKPQKDSEAAAGTEPPIEVAAPLEEPPISHPSAETKRSAAEIEEVESEEEAADAKPKRRFRFSAETMFFRKLLTSGLLDIVVDRGVVAMGIFIAISTAITLYVGALTIDAMQQKMSSPMEAFFMAAQCGFLGLMILLSLVLTANLMLPIVISSSLEQDAVENWPSFSPGDWVFQTFYIINALAIGAMPTVIFVPFLSLPTLVVLQLLTIVPIFPIAVLSMLDEGSPFAPYAPGLWRLLTVYKGLWLRFTAVGYAVGSLGVLAGSLAIYAQSFLLAVVAGPLIALLVVVYSRFLGRMAMFMSDQSIEQESLEEYDD